MRFVYLLNFCARQSNRFAPGGRDVSEQRLWPTIFGMVSKHQSSLGTAIITPILLETERLWLRPFQPADVPAFAAYRSDPEIARYQGWETPYSLEQAARFVAEMSAMPPIPVGEWYQLAIQPKDYGAIIGDCAFHVLAEDGQQAEIGFSLSRAYQGRGYAAEAVRRLLGYLFEERNLHRVRAICDVENTASGKLLERVGMRREAQHIENVWFKGRWSSEYVYAILAFEWPARKL